MHSEKLASDLKPHLEIAEKAAAHIKDPRLREIAFAKVLDHLLASRSASSEPKDFVTKTRLSGKITQQAKEKRNSRVGATGGLRSLIEEGQLDLPRTASEIIGLLKQSGRHYSRPSVMMGLLSLVRERILTRFNEKGEKNWKYVIRR